MASPFWSFAARMSRRKGKLILAGVMAVVSASGLGAGLLSLPPILNNVIGEERSTLRDLAAESPVALPPGLVARLPGEPFESVVWIITGLFLLSLVGAAANFLHQYLSLTVAASTVADLRRAVFRHALRLPLLRVAGGASDLVSRMLTDTEVILSGLIAITSKASAQIARGAVALVAAFVIDWRLALASLVAAPVLYTVIRKLGKRIRRAYRGAMESKASLMGVASESLGGLRVIKVYHAERSALGRFTRHNRRALQQELRARTARALSSPVVELVSILVVGAIVIVSTKFILDGHLSPGQFMGALVALGVAGSQLKPLTRIVQELQAADSAAVRLQEILGAETDARLIGRDRQPAFARHRDSIRFEGVRMRYPEAGHEALAGVDLEVGFGETVAFVGPNGSGKTTLLSLVPRLFDPTGGSVKLDGRDLREGDIRSLRRQIGVVTQDVVLFSGSVHENIALGRPGVSREAVTRAAKRARAHEFIEQIPGGYDAVLGEGGLSLSGGQRQRLSIARAILRDPAILILDEATSMIDAESERRIGEALDEFGRGRTCLIVAHRLATVISADRIVVMDGGRVEDVGTHEELLGRCALYRSLARGQLVAAAAPEAARS
jgi:ATP-binding cassette, subfamily B, bacterial MsbA